MSTLSLGCSGIIIGGGCWGVIGSIANRVIIWE